MVYKVMQQVLKCKNKGIEEIYNMLKKPQTPKAKNALFRLNAKGCIKSTCALGELGFQKFQGKLFNLSDVENLMKKLGVPEDQYDTDAYDGGNLIGMISEWNNSTRMSKPEIADKIRYHFSNIA